MLKLRFQQSNKLSAQLIFRRNLGVNQAKTEYHPPSQVCKLFVDSLQSHRCGYKCLRCKERQLLSISKSVNHSVPCHVWTGRKRAVAYTERKTSYSFSRTTDTNPTLISKKPPLRLYLGDTFSETTSGKACLFYDDLHGSGGRRCSQIRSESEG